MKRRIFDHVIIVMFENEYRGLVLENENLQNVVGQGVNMTNYFGTYHPSQTNYIASIAGEQCGWRSAWSQGDSQVWPLFQQNTIVDLLEAAGVEWKAYMEDFPNTPWNPQWATTAYYDAGSPPPSAPPFSAPPPPPPQPTPSSTHTYQQKHNAFASFLNNQFQASRWQRIVSLTQFWKDVENGTLPQYAWITPNMWNDGHWQRPTGNTPHDRSVLIDQISDWLGNRDQDNDTFLSRLKFPGPASKLPPRTLVVLTFDESDFEDTGYEGPNRIYTVLLGDVVHAGTQESEPYNHYSLLRTIEENFSLGTLGKNDASSNWFRFLWHEGFSWGPPVSTPATTSGPIAAAAYGSTLFLVTQDSEGNLSYQTNNGHSWSVPTPIGQKTSGAVALAPCGDALLLVFQDAESQQLLGLAYTAGGGWGTSPVSLGQKTAGHITMTALQGGGAMLVYTEVSSGSNYPMSSILIHNPAFEAQAPQPINQSTDGSLALSTLGSTVYLVYSQAASGSSTPSQSSQMLMASYETAFFKTISDNAPNDTVAYAWSPPPTQIPPPPGSQYVVGQVGHNTVDTPPSTTPTLIAPDSRIVMAELDGCIQLITNSATSTSLITEVFSLSGIMTSGSPTALKPSSNESNGYGTLMEAGWGPVENIGIRFEAAQKCPLATATFDGRVCLFFTKPGSEQIEMGIGKY